MKNLLARIRSALRGNIADAVTATPDKLLEKEYLQAGAEIGDALSYAYMGECVGFDGMIERWTRLEREYAARGYRTVSVDDLIEYGGGYIASIDHLFGVKRDAGEEPVYHADRFARIRDLTFSQPNLVQEALETGKVVTGTYFLPSTKDEKDNP